MNAATTTFRDDATVIGWIGAAHMVSHFFQLVLPALFPVLKVELGVGYAALGLVMTVFFTVSGVLQTVAGFMTDRFGGRIMLILGVVCISLGALLAAAIPSYVGLMLAAVLFGVGNSVFHPADFSILNAKVGARRLGHAFSTHALGGNLGWALAPLFMLSLSAAVGWRVALMCAALVGLVFAALLATQAPIRVARVSAGEHRSTSNSSARDNVALLLSRPVLMCFGFFFFSAFALIGMQNFMPVALNALYGISVGLAGTVLTGFLLGSAAGIFVGGFIATHTDNHGSAAVAGLALGAVCLLVIASGVAHTALLPTAALAGFFIGSVAPSRDILVRRATPPESRGKVYGFAYSGLDLGSSLAPLMVGWVMDHHAPRLVFVVAALFILINIATVVQIRGAGRLRATASA